MTSIGVTSIGGYGFLSDCRSAALVSRDGSIDWHCPVSFDAPSVFGRILDPDGGHWWIGPVGKTASKRAYVGESLVLRTEFEGPDGAVAVTDFMALAQGSLGHDIGKRVPHALVRIVEGIRGRVTLEMELVPRFEYGLALPWLEAREGVVEMRAGPTVLRLESDGPVDLESDRIIAHFEIDQGQSRSFVLRAIDPLDDAAQDRSSDGTASELLEATLEGWRSWNELHVSYDGEASALARRSAVVLQGLTDARTGAVIAAPTTSLPAHLGRGDTWDYRYVWLRDLSFTMRALWVAACPTEADRFLGFLANSLGRPGDRHVPIVLGSDGRRDISEHQLDHLAGHRDNRPVRVGNQAWDQRQLDVMGEVLDSAYLLREQTPEFDPESREMLRDFADRAAAGWRELDAGMWEARDRERHYTSSKVMCWVALDRAVKLSARLGEGIDTAGWERERDEIHATVVREAWSESAGAYAGAFGSDQLDASVLLMPLVDFLPATDSRMAATIRHIDEGLSQGPLIRRWKDEQNGFVICSYWLVECLALMGDVDAARERFEALNGLANDLGLMGEMFDPASGQIMGNFPQTFSHVGMINASWRLTELGRRSAPGE
ncbi:MAG: glycoside hydrolase family 15 protein [Chloroflexota bacterium]|nr:glycoside hydrolase family 15 protein [Chloroflexota bacterium]